MFKRFFTVASKSRSELFTAPNLKIVRAGKHIEDLDAAIIAYLRQDPIKLMTSLDEETGDATHFLESNKPIPWDIPLIFGDAVHALRAALDLTIFGMVGDKTTRPDQVQFPFAKNAAALENTIVNRQVKFAGTRVVDKIIASKPYLGGNELLYACHTLDIADKHKLILPTASIANMSGPDFAEIWPDPNITQNMSFMFGMDTFLKVRGGAAYFRKRDNPASLKYERKRHPPIQIELAEGQPLQAKPLVLVLDLMLNEVRDTVKSMIDAYCSP